MNRRLAAVTAAALALAAFAGGCYWLIGGEEHRRKEAIAKHTATAQLHETAGNYEGAADEYRALIELAPRLTEAYQGLGDNLNRLGRYAEAAAAYRKAVELDPNVYAYHFNLGVALARNGQAVEAAAAFEKAAALKPKAAEPYIYWGSALRDAGDYPGSAAALARALVAEPDNTFAHLNLAMTLEYTDPGRAIGEWEKVRNAPDAEPAWRELAAERLRVLRPEE